MRRLVPIVLMLLAAACAPTPPPKTAATLKPLGPCPASAWTPEAPPPTAAPRPRWCCWRCRNGRATAGRSSPIRRAARRAPSSSASRSARRRSASTTTGRASASPTSAASTATCRGRRRSSRGTSRAPASPRDLFCPDARHTIYVERMVERARRPGAAFIPRHLDERAPQVGDLICASRDSGGTTLENLNRGPGHCDIVVEVRPGEVHAIGGNVGELGHPQRLSTGRVGLFVAHIRPTVLHRDREQTALGRHMRLYDPTTTSSSAPARRAATIANRLAEDTGLRILILEAGPPDSSFLLKMPAGFASLGEKSPYNWRYETVPQVHCNNRAHVLAARQDAGRLVVDQRHALRARPRLRLRPLAPARQRGLELRGRAARSSRRPRTTSAAPTPITAAAAR